MGAAIGFWRGSKGRRVASFVGSKAEVARWALAGVRCCKAAEGQGSVGRCTEKLCVVGCRKQWSIERPKFSDGDSLQNHDLMAG